MAVHAGIVLYVFNAGVRKRSPLLFALAHGLLEMCQKGLRRIPRCGTLEIVYMGRQYAFDLAFLMQQVDLGITKSRFHSPVLKYQM